MKFLRHLFNPTADLEESIADVHRGRELAGLPAEERECTDPTALDAEVLAALAGGAQQQRHIRSSTSGTAAEVAESLQRLHQAGRVRRTLSGAWTADGE